MADRISDKELADRCVQLGFLTHCGGEYKFQRQGCVYPDWVQPAEDAVESWDLAGALMERCDEWLLTEPCNGAWFVSRKFSSAIVNDSLPRAIIEACIKALEQRSKAND